VLIAVVTAPSHFSARDAIRTTWGARVVSGSNPNFDIRFFIGKQPDPQIEAHINAEANIIRLDGVVEAYQNLSRKVLGIVHWAKNNNYNKILKVDDDTYVRVDMLEKFLATLPTTKDVYGGHFQDHGVVIDNPNSKWYMRDQYPEEIYPSYAFGPCYFLGNDMVDFIAGGSSTLFPYRVEDAGIAIWTKSLTLTRVAFPGYLYHANCQDAPPDSLFIAPVNSQEMKLVYQNCRAGKLCGKYGEFMLDECVFNRCRCWPPSEDSCYSDFANQGYEDVIPRLVQFEARTVSVKQEGKVGV